MIKLRILRYLIDLNHHMRDVEEKINKCEERNAYLAGVYQTLLNVESTLVEIIDKDDEERYRESRRND